MTNDHFRGIFFPRAKHLIPDQFLSTAENSIMSVFIASNVNANLNLACGAAAHVLLRPVLVHYHAQAVPTHISLAEVSETQVMLGYVGRIFNK